MEKEQCWAFVKDPKFSIFLFEKIKDKISFDIIDKKKFSLPQL